MFHYTIKVAALRDRAENGSCEADPPAYLAFLRTVLLGHSPQMHAAPLPGA